MVRESKSSIVNNWEKKAAFRMWLAVKRASDSISNNWYYGNKTIRNSNTLWPIAKKVSSVADKLAAKAEDYYVSKWWKRGDISHAAARLGAKRK